MAESDNPDASSKPEPVRVPERVPERVEDASADESLSEQLMKPLEGPTFTFRFDTCLVIEREALNRTPPGVMKEIEPLLGLLDGRPVASVVAGSPLGSRLTLRVLERLVSCGALRAAEEQGAAGKHEGTGKNGSNGSSNGSMTNGAGHKNGTAHKNGAGQNGAHGSNGPGGSNGHTRPASFDASASSFEAEQMPHGAAQGGKGAIRTGEHRFSALEETFFASEAAEILEERRLAAIPDVSPTTGSYKAPPAARNHRRHRAAPTTGTRHPDGKHGTARKPTVWDRVRGWFSGRR